MNAPVNPEALLAEQPIRRVTRGDTEFVLLGTAHVSRASADAVRALLEQEPFDAVAIELCAHRTQALRNPDAVAEMDLFRVLREGRAGVVAAGLALGAYQRRLADQFGIEPGAEMKAAMDGADARNVPLWLIDRDVGTTLRRARGALGFWDRTKLSAGLLGSLLDDSEIDEAEIEKLKQGDILQNTFAEFAKQSAPLYDKLIAERDRYMAARLREEAELTKPRRVLAVVGAGHLEGLVRHLEQAQDAPADILPPLRAEPPPSQFAKWFGIALIVFVVGAVAWGFTRDFDVGMDVLWIWIGTTAVLGGIGAAIARAHPLSVIATILISPLTPLHPTLSSGMVAGAIELWKRKPRVGDFQRLREDLVHVRGWWRNRVAHVFLVFMLANLGTALGVWLASFRIGGRLVP